MNLLFEDVVTSWKNLYVNLLKSYGDVTIQGNLIFDGGSNEIQGSPAFKNEIISENEIDAQGGIKFNSETDVLNKYEEGFHSVVFPHSSNDLITSDITVQLDYAKVGKHIIMEGIQFTTIQTAANTATLVSEALPAGLRPENKCYWFVMIQNDTNKSQALLELDTTGIFTLYGDNEKADITISSGGDSLQIIDKFPMSYLADDQ